MADIVQFPIDGFRPVNDASLKRVVDGMTADLRMESGRVYRAIWIARGRCTAWWPLSGPRKRPIGLMDPVAFRPVHLASV
jgi:hypothetical protein